MLYVDSLKKVKGLGSKTANKIIESLTSETPVHIERKVFR